MPTVSVLLPVYNAERTLKTALASLLRQTFSDFEIIAVDDGSTDASPQILDAFDRVTAVHLPHVGLVAALNAGVQLCRGEFIARMDADDISHPERLRSQVEYLRANPDVSICGCLVCSFPRNRIRLGFLRYQQWLNSLITHDDIVRDIFVESPLAHPSVMIRASDLYELGGYRDMGWPEDYDLWLRFFMAGKRFGKVPALLLFWRDSAGRLTFSDTRYALENFMRLKAHFLARLIGNRTFLLWGAGMTGRRLAKHLIREGAQPSAIVDIDPRKVGRIVRNAPVIWPEQLEDFPNAIVIAAVSSFGARQLIRQRLNQMGRTEGVDYFCAA